MGVKNEEGRLWNINYFKIPFSVCQFTTKTHTILKNQISCTTCPTNWFWWDYSSSLFGVKIDQLQITGASGFVGYHTLVLALKAGYRARAVLRKESQIEELKQSLSDEKLIAKVAFVIVKDLAAENALDGVFNDVTYVFHIASPMNTVLVSFNFHPLFIRIFSWLATPDRQLWKRLFSTRHRHHNQRALRSSQIKVRQPHCHDLFHRRNSQRRTNGHRHSQFRTLHQ